MNYIPTSSSIIQSGPVGVGSMPVSPVTRSVISAPMQTTSQFGYPTSTTMSTMHPMMSTTMAGSYSQSKDIYHPPDSTYVPPGVPLRGGMYAIYDPNSVPTFEGALVFEQALDMQPGGSMVQREIIREREAISEASSSDIQRVREEVTVKKGRRYCC